jgi:hypothetical protein
MRVLEELAQRPGLARGGCGQSLLLVQGGGVHQRRTDPTVVY